MKFYTNTTNSRGKPVTAGSHHGQTTHTRTWTHGVKVVSYIDTDGQVKFAIYGTSGSNNSEEVFAIGNLTLGKKGPQFKASKKVKATT
jgi:hypothetical protein